MAEMDIDYRFRFAAFFNAGRLLADAELLLANERYASALAHSILCIEEIGKFADFNRAPEDMRKVKQSHQHRQDIARKFFLLLCWHTALCEHFGLTLMELQDTYHERSNATINALYGVQTDALDIEPDMKALALEILATPLMRLAMKIAPDDPSKTLSTMRERATYVDFQEGVIHTPDSTKAEIATEMIDLVRTMIALLRTNILPVKIS